LCRRLFGIDAELTKDCAFDVGYLSVYDLLAFSSLDPLEGREVGGVVSHEVLCLDPFIFQKCVYVVHLPIKYMQYIMQYENLFSAFIRLFF
jgi:hypothetical protein